MDHGVLVRGEHNHAVTQTCPGHAAISTGSNPSHTGIVANEWYDTVSEKTVNCVRGPSFENAPGFLERSAIGDWLRADCNSCKVISISGKDRAAIMLGGKNPTGVFWYNKQNGKFVSSSYYAPIPTWVSSFNDEHHPDKFFGTMWEPLSSSEMSKKDQGLYEIFHLPEGVFIDSFPHHLGEATLWPSEEFYSNLYSSPFLDDLTLSSSKGRH